MSLAVTQRPDPATLAARVREMLDRGRPAAARPLVAALRATGASRVLATELEARLLWSEGRTGDALTLLDAHLADAGPNADLCLTRAEICLVADDLVGAAVDAADAVMLDRRNAAAKAILGHVLLRLGQITDAISCLDEALAANVRAVPTRLDLATALDAAGSPELGDAVVAGGLALDPCSSALVSATLLRRIRSRDPEAAISLARDARRRGALDACGFGLLGHALSSIGRNDEAADAYVEALKLAPDDRYVMHLAAAAGRLDPGNRAPPDYVRVLFDGYAGHFETHLVQLGYRVPGLMRAVLADAGCDAGPVLDLGCGTGLLAVTCGDLTGTPWIGVDLSPRMLAAARTKNLYDELHEADILSYLANEQRSFPLVVAGDVLCYFGALGPVLDAVAARLAPGGRFVFTVESLDAGTDGVRLGTMGRYVHSRPYILAAAEAAGLEAVAVAGDVLRLEGGAPVPGLVVTLARSA